MVDKHKFNEDELEHKIKEIEQEKILKLANQLQEKNLLLEKIQNQFEELRNTYENLSATEIKYHRLYESSPDLLRTVNQDGIIIDCNTTYVKNLGYSKEEIIGMSIYDHTADGNLDRMRDVFGTWKGGKTITNKEIWLKRKNGTIFPVLLSATTMYDGEKVIGSNTTIKDITEIYEAKKKIEESEALIRKQYEELKELDKSKSEFLAMITHELKTPLVPIKGYVDILLSDSFESLTDKQRERIAVVKKNTEYLLKLISNILDVQKIEMGELKLNMERYNLAGIINETVQNLKPDAEIHGIAILTFLEPETYCMCDKLRIGQVINNLISNSIDFCSIENGQIQIKLYYENENLRIIIKDNGVGIQKDKLEKIFTKFYQVDTSSTREHGGTGVGLAVCKGIVESHGGKIWAESEGRDKGAEVHILLPRQE